MTGADLALAATVAVAATAQATTGIGFALVVAPVAAAIRPDLLPGALILLMLPLNAWVFWRERGGVDKVGVGWITAGRVVGALLALALLATLSQRGLSLLIGVSTLLAVLASWLAPRFRPDRAAFATAGLVTGVTETATGIGGPPLALVFQHRPPPELRASVALSFLLGEIMSVALLLPAGLLTRDQMVAFLALLPAVAVGVAASFPLRARLPAGALRTIVLVFAAVSSVLIVARAI